MTIRHRYISPTLLHPGMVLARPLVIAERGRVNLRMPSGRVLTETCIEQILAHRAEYICVEENDTRSEAECESDGLRQEARLAHIFRFANLESPNVRAFYNALLTYRKS